MKRKRVAGLLTLISMVVSMMPAFVFAADNPAEADVGAGGAMAPAEIGVDTSKAITPENEGRWLDKVIFGNEESEKAHNLVAPYSSVVKDGALGETARIARATNSYNGSSITFTMKVDPVLQNYFTVKIWSTGEESAKCSLFVGDEHWGHHMYGDHVLLFFGGKNENIDQFTYYTRLIPKKYTEGKTELELTLRTTENYAPLTRDSAPYYAAYTHNQAYIDVSGEKMGSPKKRTVGEGAPVKPAYSSDEIEKILQDYRDNQIKTALDYAAESKLAINKYAYHSRSLAISLSQPWSPHKNPEDKRAVIYYMFNSIDNHVRDYYNNVRLVQQGGHQADWGSYYRELGMTLYLLENLIFDDAIIGQEAFDRFLDEPFVTNSVDGQYSIRGVDWDGGQLTRRGAWERCLKASYDHSRYRHAYISNQVFYYGEGCWEAQQGLRIIGSQFYEGQERSDYFIGMILGLCPWLGPEELVGPNGEELDLYNSIWTHNPGVFTRDQTQIVAKGLAKSKLDENGEQVYRMPYGPAYYNVSWWGLGRENTYVTNYGETMNYWPYWFFMTYGHETTKEVNDELLKLALRGFYARNWMRYTNVDDNGYRGARIEYVLDFRSPGAYSGKDAYYGPVGGNPYPLYAALEYHMVTHEEEYSDPEWDWYWELARECVGYFQQAIIDNQGIDAGNGNLYPEVYRYATRDRANYPRFNGELMAGVVAPQTRFEFYTQEEIDKLKVNPDDYRSNAWTDVDIMHVSIRDDDQTIFGSMYYGNNGYNNIGYMRIIEDNLERHLQISTSGILRTYDYRMRPSSFGATHWADGDKTKERQRFGIANELLPISYQPGVGTVSREWNELDNPYAGYPELLTARYQKYFIVFNTTRESYGNERTFDVEIPSDFKGDKVEDLVTHEWLPIVDGKVTVNPFRGYVLKLTENFQKEIKPYPITITLARQAADHIDITWREGIGAASYGILRSEEEYGEYKEIASGVRGLSYTDTDVTPGKTYYYKTYGINEFGKGEPSWQAKVDFTQSVSLKNSEWRDDRIFTSTGTAEVNGSDVSIKGVDGIGLQCGDDEVVRLRELEDSFHFVNQTMTGSGTITAKVESFGGSKYGGPRYETGTGKPLAETNEELNAKRYDYVFDWDKSITGVPELNGIMMRENLDKNGAHIYLGAAADGTIVLRNRTRDSMATQSNPCHGGQKSPYKFDIGNYNIKDYPWLRLSRHYGTSYVSAYISKDGKDWLQLGTTQLVSITTFTADDGTDRKTTGFEVFSPMPYVSYIGLVSTENTVFSNVSVSDTALLGGRLARDMDKVQENLEYDVVVTENEMDLLPDGEEDGAGQQFSME